MQRATTVFDPSRIFVACDFLIRRSASVDGTELIRVIALQDTGRSDVARVGGKNASLGELLRALREEGIKVPPGFATTAAAYWEFVDHNGLRPVIARGLDDLKSGRASLAAVGLRIREAFVQGAWPEALASNIRESYAVLCRETQMPDADVAVRSSATAEDLPDASFAGQQESFLNIRGERALLDACRRCYASLFTDRAISYREAKGFDHLKVALSIGVQKMVRSDLAGSGVMFSIDTESGFDGTVLIDAAWGLGENVVQGNVDPDEYLVFKPLLSNHSLIPIIEKRCGEKAQRMIYDSTGSRTTLNVETTNRERAAFVLSDPEILQLARWACTIERHYGTAMDIEWAKDGTTGEIFIVQARPETVRSRQKSGALKTYRLLRKGARLLTGFSVGEAAVGGTVCRLESIADIEKFQDGAILVTGATDPDWVPVMKRASALITDHGGRTSHAAIVSRELGLPAVIGTGTATATLVSGRKVTVSCAEGEEGFVYDGLAEIETKDVDLSAVPATRTKVMLNLGDPAAALRWWRLPVDGVGLARLEFVVSAHVKVHPMALAHFDSADPADRERISALTSGYADKSEYFIDRVARGLARIAALAYPNPMILRTSDFKSNEYADLVGGRSFEPVEENPMLGLRGASRYYSPRYEDAFALECRAIRRLRESMGFTNVIVMIPFCRTPAEADRVLAVMERNGLKRGSNGLQVYVMCEIPSNVILAKEFAKRFDGFSIGSNDLTQLTLGVDRDSTELAALFDERDDAVKWMIREVIREAHVQGVKVGLCGQAPSNHPAFAAFLVECGIDSVSVSPDSFFAVKNIISATEGARRSAGHDEVAGRDEIG